MESLLIITGAMGAGKTTVLAEASDILGLHKIAHAAIDLDALGLAYLPGLEAAGESTHAVMYRNLKSICENYVSLGVQRLLLARAIENRTEFDLCQTAVSAANTTVCSLIASPMVTAQRVAMRESGALRDTFIARSAGLNSILDKVRLEDFSITNENRSVNEVAQEMLIQAGWIPK